MFEKGMIVYDINRGRGIVSNINTKYLEDSNPIEVTFDFLNYKIDFTIDGRLVEGSPQTLFSYPIEKITSENIDEKYQKYIGKWGMFWRHITNVSISQLKKITYFGSSPIFYAMEERNAGNYFAPLSEKVIEELELSKYTYSKEKLLYYKKQHIFTEDEVKKYKENYIGKWGIFKGEHKNFISKLKRIGNYKGSNEFISTYLEGGFSFEPLTKEEIKILNLE